MHAESHLITEVYLPLKLLTSHNLVQIKDSNLSSGVIKNQQPTIRSGNLKFSKDLRLYCGSIEKHYMGTILVSSRKGIYFSFEKLNFHVKVMAGTIFKIF